MKAFFFCNMFPGDVSRGITKKVTGQIKAFEELGVFVEYVTGYTLNGAAVFNRDGNIVLLRKYKFKNKLYRRIIRNKLLKKVSLEFFKNSHETFDLCYLRYLYFDFIYLKLLKEMKSKSRKVFIEAHSYPTYNKYKFSFYPVYFLDFLLSRRVKKYVDLVVAIGENFSNIWGIKTICIENGIDLSNITIQRKKNADNNEIRFIAVSYEWLAHGYDRFIKGMHNYYKNNPAIKVKLILVGTVMDSTLKLIKKYHLEPYIEITGIKSGSDLDDLYNRSDIGIGALAAFRVNVISNCELKTREYLAKGLPYIYSGADNAEDNFPYRYRIPSDETPVDINAVLEYYNNLQCIPGYVDAIRKLSSNYTWLKQYESVFQNQ